MIDARPSIALRTEISPFTASCARRSRVLNGQFALNHTSLPRRHHAAICLTSSPRSWNRTKYTYDAQGRTATRTVTIDGVALATLFGRDSLGRVTSVTYPSGKVLSIAYADGRVSALHLDGAPLATSIAYFPFGGPESWVFGNGTQYLRAIDANGRIAAFTTPRGDKSLAFDAAGRITRIDRHVGETTDSQAFGYDTTGRLTSFAGYTSQAPLETQSFTYDANGNRLTATLNATTRAYSYVAGSNRLASVSGLYANTWDAAGNLLADGQRSFTYDARGRLASATMGALTTTYRHNARGQRVMKTNAQETVRYLHDEAGHLLGEYGPSGTPLREYVWLGDTPLAVLGREPAFCAEGASPPCEGVAYLWTDHLNSPREATNAANRRIWAWESLPFGESAPNESPEGLAPFTLNLRFPGQYFDRETGLHQNSQREYAPFVGQYTQTDPIGIAAGPNPLSYVNNTPLSRTDSLGLWACSSEQYADLYFDTFLGFNETLADEGLRSVLSIAGLGSALAAEVNGMTSMQALNYIVRQYVFSPRAFRGEMTISAAGRVFNAALARGMIISSLGPLATVEAGLAFGASIQAYQRCIQACFP
ncbi:MAG: RHS repeat protein [Betaproteobacteria bacterium]|nr:RHS repeat protein [Betaproteobacteria bacterium]